MARYTGPKCKLCRREGVKLYIKGAKCNSENCPMNKRPYAPGQHGNTRQKKSEYREQLREKQKAKRIYGILERQFKNYVKASLKEKGISGEILVQKLESRIDNLVYRGGFAVSRAQARQFIRRSLFTVNGRAVQTPSQLLKVGDIIKPVSIEKIHLREGFVMPEWLEANVKEKQVKYVRMPKLDDLVEGINVQSIIESYSR